MDYTLFINGQKAGFIMGLLILLIGLVVLFWLLCVVDAIYRRFARDESITFQKLLPFSKAFEAKPVLASIIAFGALAIFL